jgi:ethanolamine utilization protein EutA
MTQENQDGVHSHAGFVGVHSHEGGAPHWHDEFGEHLFEDLSAEEFAARQLDWRKHNVQIVTVGIDIGSSTSHLMFSKIYLQLVGEAPDVRAVVVGREILYQSPIWLTPYLPDNTIDIAALDEYFAEAYGAVDATREHIDTGAIILTGEALKRVNARTIATLFALEAGQFVCATAGHHMEAVLAANGSGTVARSRRDQRTLLNVDIGGGTTKLALVLDGQVIATAAVAIGARLIARDPSASSGQAGRLTRVDDPARTVADALGITLTLGEPLAPDDERRIVQAWTDVLAGLVQRKPPEGLAAQLMLTEPLPASPRPQALTFSGGVSEYIFQREERDFGDLGLPFAKAIRAALSRNVFGLPAIIDPNLGIRATAVGASQFDVQGGVNAYVTDESILPLMNVPVLVPRIELDDDVSADAVAASIRDALTRADLVEGEQPIALTFALPGSEAHEPAVRALAEGIRAALPTTTSGAAALALVVNQGISNTFVTPDQDFHVLKEQRPASRLGRLLKEGLGTACDVVAVEGVHLSEFDFVDVGRVMHPSEVVPMTVKSLLFAGGMDRRSVKQALIDAALKR